MTQPEPAILRAVWARVSEDGSVNRSVQDYPVQYNPSELSLEKNVQLGEITIPGLDAPLQQFVYGQAEKLTVELFFDTTEDGMGANATSVTTETDQIYKLVKVESDSHAPPVVTFIWNEHFSGDTLTAGSGNQLRNSFTGVVESIRQQFLLFSPEGVPLRAKINLVLREYRTLEEQLNQLRLNSPERTHSRLLQAGESLSTVAGKYYQRPGDWRTIAIENDIEDPRRLTPGTVLSIPAITRRASS
jgi:nucleoid-associated protein YgaU